MPEGAGLFSPQLRGVSIAIFMTVALSAFEGLAVAAALPEARITAITVQPMAGHAGNGVGREIYVRSKNVGAQEVTLSAPLHGAGGSQSYTFRDFKYLLDFKGFESLSKFELAEVVFGRYGSQAAEAYLALPGWTTVPARPITASWPPTGPARPLSSCSPHSPGSAAASGWRSGSESGWTSAWWPPCSASPGWGRSGIGACTG